MISVRNPSDWTAMRVRDLVRLASRLAACRQRKAQGSETGLGMAHSPVSEDDIHIVRAVRILRKLSWKDIDTPLPDGQSLLACLDEYGCPQLARFVVDSGAASDFPGHYHFRPEDLDAARLRDFFLAAAARRAPYELWHDEDPSVRKIAAALENLSGAELNRRLEDGATLLLHFVGADCGYLAGKAVDRGADLSAKWSAPSADEGKTSLDLCLENGFAETARILAFSGVPCETLGGVFPFPQAETLAKKWYAVERTLVLRCGANPDSADAEGQGIWHYAAMTGDPELCSIAAELNADPNSQRTDGLAPLHIAALRGDVSCIETLLARGADPAIRSRNRETPLALAVRSLKPAAALSLERALSPSCYYDGSGNTELHYAVMNANLQYCRFLLFRRFSASVRNNRRESPLDVAKQRGNPLFVSLLEGSVPPILAGFGQQAIDAITGIRKFREGEDTDGIAAKFIERMPWDEFIAPLFSGNQLFLYLVRLNRAELVGKAIGRGSGTKITWKEGGNDPFFDMIYADDGRCTPAGLATEGQSALDIAFENGFKETIRVLLEAGASIPEFPDGRSALSVALTKRWLDVAHWLVQRGVDTERIDRQGQSVWHYAAAIDDRDFVRFAKSLECSLSRPRSGDRMTPLHVAASAGNDAAVRTLLALGADPLARTEDGESALGLAIRNGHPSCFDLILEAKDIEAYGDAEGRTLLHCAIRAGNSELSSYLVDRGFHIDAPDVMGETPLMLAVFAGDIELSAVLIDRGANPVARRHDGKTPLDIAHALKSSPLMVAMLMNAEAER